jgi:membrane-bound ClpP family serine protease
LENASGDDGVLLVVMVALAFAVPLLFPRLASLAAHLGIWASGKLAGRDEIYGADRADEGRLARHGRARTALAPRGKVFVSGELWNAEAADGSRVAAGERVEVVSREGMLLRVRAVRDVRDEGSA